MANATLMLLLFILIFILILLVVSLILRIKNLEKRLVNFTPTEAYTIMETMRDMVIESERVADKLDAAIKDRESVLEDLSDLVDEKIARLDKIVDNSDDEKNRKTLILSLYKQGLNETEIARRLNISVAEVTMSLNLSKDML